jgi:hypothetical protein
MPGCPQIDPLGGITLMLTSSAMRFKIAVDLRDLGQGSIPDFGKVFEQLVMLAAANFCRLESE